MKREEIFMELTDIFEAVFYERIELTDSTCADDIEDWDSLAQITLIDSIEKKYSVKFVMKDIVNLKNVGEMVDLIEKSIKK